MEKYTLLIRKIGNKLIDIYSKNNQKIYCGINGPYDDKETKVRNLAHLIIITAVEILVFENNNFIADLKIMGKELQELSQADGTYIMREKKGKDYCNGVIGHSWVIESLVYLYKVFGDKTYLSVAEQICLKHHFQEDIGLWERPTEISHGERIDYTLNHQLWYAASLAELNLYVKSEDIKRQLNVFMDKLQLNFGVGIKGKVTHSIYRRMGFVDSVKNRIKKAINFINETVGRSSLKYKEQGYHVFNMMALARLYQIYPMHSFFTSSSFLKAIRYCNSYELFNGLTSKRVALDNSFINSIGCEDEKDINIYGYPYNVPGFEMEYCGKVFSNLIKKEQVERAMEEQFTFTYNISEDFFGLKCHDKSTINYRVYEYYRYLEIENGEKN